MVNVTDQVSDWLGVPALSRAWRDAQSAIKALKFLREDLDECSPRGFLVGEVEEVVKMIDQVKALDNRIALILRSAHDRMIPPARKEEQ